MAAIKEKVYTVTTSSGVYRFADLVEHATHYSARQVLGTNLLGRMVHRLSKSEIEQATVTEETLNDSRNP